MRREVVARDRPAARRAVECVALWRPAEHLLARPRAHCTLPSTIRSQLSATSAAAARAARAFSVKLLIAHLFEALAVARVVVERVEPALDRVGDRVASRADVPAAESRRSRYRRAVLLRQAHQRRSRAVEPILFGRRLRSRAVELRHSALLLHLASEAVQVVDDGVEIAEPEERQERRVLLALGGMDEARHLVLAQDELRGSP